MPWVRRHPSTKDGSSFGTKLLGQYALNRCTKITSCCTTCTTTQQRGVNKGLDSNSYEHDQHACAWTKCIMVSSPTSCCAGNGASLFWQCSRPFMVGEGKKRRSRSPCLRKRLRTLAACHTLLEGTSRRRVCSVASSSAGPSGRSVACVVERNLDIKQSGAAGWPARDDELWQLFVLLSWPIFTQSRGSPAWLPNYTQISTSDRTHARTGPETPRAEAQTTRPHTNRNSNPNSHPPPGARPTRPTATPDRPVPN